MLLAVFPPRCVWTSYYNFELSFSWRIAN
jgi:hypothetical protein